MTTNPIPDISNINESQYSTTLEKVGMENIELPILIELNDKLTNTSAKINLFINLIDPKAKGIHMSRLFLLAQEHLTKKPLSDQNLNKLLKLCIKSHTKLSTQAFIKINFNLFIERKALLTENKGWKAYPITIEYKLENQKIERQFSVTVTYSSTCPCSAALARRDVQQNFMKQNKNQKNFTQKEIFKWLDKESSISATPHAQRSEALIKVKNSTKNLAFIELINLIENNLKTATQAAVKREDEQEFARLNGSNLMFCEDAAKKLKLALNKNNFAEDFYIKVKHFESLHPHDATAISVKNIKNGYKA